MPGLAMGVGLGVRRRASIPLPVVPETLAIVQAPNDVLQEYGTAVQVDITAVASGNHLWVGVMASNSAGEPVVSSPGLADWGEPEIVHVGPEVTTRYYKREAITDGDTYVRANFYPNAGEFQMGVMELDGGATLAVTDSDSAAQSNSATWDFPFTSIGANAAMMGFGKLSNSATPESIAPAVTTSVNGWYAYVRGLFPTSGDNTAEFSLGADSRSGTKSWVVVEAVGVGSGGGGGEVEGSVTPALTASYVDTSGDPQRTPVVDGVTTITGAAPFTVSLNAHGFVSTEPTANTADKAFCTLEYLFEFDEGRGTTHATTGLPTDTERGGPVAGYVYEVPGTYQPRVWGRDSAGNQGYIRLNVVVTDPGAGVDMTSGVLPTFIDDTVYNAPAGGTWPDITNQLDGLQNVIIRKSGSGANPSFNIVNLDSRNEPDSAITRTRGVRFLNCDVARVEYGNVGFDSCAFVNGHVGELALRNMYDAANQVIAQEMTSQQAQNVRMADGLILQNTGELGEPAETGGYVLIGEIRGLHLRGVTLTKSSTGQHNTRGVFKESSFRNCVFNNTTAGSVSYLKLQGWDCTDAGKDTPDTWTPSGMVVTGEGGRRLGLPLSMACVSDCVMGLSGSDEPDANIGIGPENNDADADQGCELTRIDHCVTPWTTQWYTVDLSGRYLACRDYRLNGGAGALVNVNENTVHPNRTPTGWDGPTYVGAALDPVVVP